MISEVHNIDCMEAMAQMKDNEFDLAIVDPPYGIGETWSKSKRDQFYTAGRDYSYKNTTPPDGEYFQQLFRISKDQIIWGANYFTNHLSITNAWIVWNKGQTHLDHS